MNAISTNLATVVYATLRLIGHFCVLSTDIDSGSYWVPVKRDRKAEQVSQHLKAYSEITSEDKKFEDIDADMYIDQLLKDGE